MIIKKKKTEKFVMPSGIGIYLEMTEDRIENARKNEKAAKQAYDKDKSAENKLDLIYAKSERLYATGNYETAIEYLNKELAEFEATPPTSVPASLLKYIDVLSLKAYILMIGLKEPEQAVEVGLKVYEIVFQNFPETSECYFAADLYATCLRACGRDEEAVDIYKRTLDGLEYEISEIQAVRDEIIKNLKEIADE